MPLRTLCVRCGVPELPRCSYVQFRSDERVSFGIAPKETKRSSPTIRPQLRWGSLAPSSLRGHAAKGHPWPIAALAASMPLNPLRNDSARPAEGAIYVACKSCGKYTSKSQSRDRQLPPRISLFSWPRMILSDHSKNRPSASIPVAFEAYCRRAWPRVESPPQAIPIPIIFRSPHSHSRCSSLRERALPCACSSCMGLSFRSLSTAARCHSGRGRRAVVVQAFPKGRYHPNEHTRAGAQR